MSPRVIFTILATALLIPSPLRAQAPDVAIETTEPLMLSEGLLEKAKVLRETGKLLTREKVSELLQNPAPALLTLPEPNTRSLAGREVAERARKAYLRLGWYYLCPRCDHWHLDLAGAYAISRDGAATCHHVLAPGREMREGYLIAVDFTGAVLAVTGVLAKSQTMDAAIVRIEGADFSPLPLNDQIAPGDTAFCFSDPLGQRGYLSRGIVNRFYKKSRSGDAPGSLNDLKHLRVNVSTDWAPGSSGAAVLDECGNVIGHVSTISPLSEDGGNPTPPANDAKANQTPPSRFNGATLIILHEAVPARSVGALARTMNEAAAKAASEKTAE